MPPYAAIDIGSNSIKMLCAEAAPGGVTRVLAEDREVTRIGESVFSAGEVSASTMDLVTGVLNRMHRTYSALDPAGVRAVATSAVRDARNQQSFLERASAALGTEVETISGLEEARLVHLGVITALHDAPDRALLVDVGGGSAEFILSERGELVQAYSKPLGAVRLWQTFLTDDPPTELQLQQLDHNIAEKMEDAHQAFGKRPFEIALGTSSSAFALVCAIHGIPRTLRATATGRKVSLGQIRDLYTRLSKMPLSDRRRVAGIGPRRAEIILPGVALFRRAMETFGISEMMVLNAGVREGIAVDLARRGIGKERLTLSEEQRVAVERVASRFGISLPHARKVAGFAVDLFAELESLHSLLPWNGRILEAAAYLVDVGHFVSATRHHKHSHYLVSNVDLPGFTEQERRLAALLCRYHRKSMPTSAHVEFTSRSEEEKRALTLLIPILRLADALDRSKDQRVQSIRCRVTPDRITLKLHHTAPVDLECWAAQRNAEIFRTSYRRALVTEPAQPIPPEEALGLS